MVAAVVLLGPATAYAQTGRIAGTVVDATSGESLPGANVIIQGTNVGAATDVDGNFVIPNAPAGTQTLVASYVGYDRQQTEVDVVPGEEINVQLELPWAGVEGEEVVITAQARGQNQAINEQITSRNIKNVVSSERIRELPDADAATAVSRLPGVSLQNGDQIVVRGIEAKFNTVAVNGVQLPSTTTDRTTSLGFISSNMLSGIEVSKVVTPAMNANSIGGNVNLRLKEADEGLHYDAMLQGDYNTQDDTYDNYRVWGSVSNRFFNDRVGAFLQANARRFNGGGDVATANWATLSAPEVDGRKRYAIDQFNLRDEVNVVDEYGASLLLDLRIPNGKILLQNAFSTERYDNVAFTDRLFLGRGQGGNREVEVDRRLGDRYLLVSSLQGEHEIANLGIDWSASHSRSRREDDLGYITRFIGSGYFEGQPLSYWTSEDQVFDLPISNDDPPETVIGNGETLYDDYGERRWVGALNLTLPVSVGFISGEFQGGGQYTWLNRDRSRPYYYQRLNEGGGQYAGADSFLTDIGWEWTQPLQLGYFRDLDYIDGRGANYLEGAKPYGAALNVDWMDEFFRKAQSGWEPRSAASNRYNYEAQEEVAAGYIMGDFNVGSYLTVLGGVRYENFSFENSATFINQTLYDGSGATLDTLEVSRSVGHWFPNIQLQVKPTDWFDLRLAYTKTTSRPDYERLLPNTFIASDVGQAGNPNLEPTLSDNYDAYLSLYANRVGLFTVGVFAKRLTNVSRPVNILRSALDEFEGTYWAPVDAGYAECEADGKLRVSCEDLDGNGIPDGPVVATLGGNDRIDTYVNNPYPGYIRGFEVDWQTNFWYLPRPFNSLVFNVNYTRLNSEMKYQSIIITKPTPFTTEQVDSSRTGRLYQQSDNVINVALGADYRGFSGRVSFRYQGEILASLAQQNPNDDQFTEPVYSWDFSVRQRLPIEGLSLFFNGVNIGHPANYNYRNVIPGLDATEVQQVHTRIAYYPTRFQLGIRYGL